MVGRVPLHQSHFETGMSLVRCIAASAFLLASAAWATVFATLQGVVHDPEHRPIAGAALTLQAANSDFTLHAVTDAQGEFSLRQVPIGVYRMNVTAAGFADFSQPIAVASGTNPVLHIPLELAATAQSIVVQAQAGTVATDSVTPTTLITRQQIEQTPGADRTLGMEMITDYVPGAYMTHNMLHVRGGHQTDWLIDGVSIPNTKIDTNVGPQIDPKDIDQLETQRGSYASDIGDRTYGVFNVLPRNGFEREREGEFLLSGGNLYFGESQLSLGDHSARTAWYTSLAGSRSNYGLETPVAGIDHDATNSESGFLSLIRNQTSKDQLRLDAQLRQDYFQVPYDPNPNDWEQASNYYNSSGLRDGQTERDAFVLIDWVHTLSPSAQVQVASFFHFNQAAYDPRPTDTPVATTWHQSSNYAGMQADLHADAGPNSFAGGVYSFFQHESDLYGLRTNSLGTPAVTVPNSNAIANAGIVEFHFSDHLRVGRWVTLLGGMRVSNYHGGYTETAAYPRIGATVEIPRLHWVLRGFYGHFFQPAPVVTVSSAFLNYASGQPGQNAFVPLPSERDEEHQFGLQIPWKGWLVDADTFETRANNYLDHANVGESNIYFPIAVDGALIQAWELAIRSPQLAHLGQFHLAYSNQLAQQRGNVIGGFTCSNPGDPACSLGPNYVPLDHDQRNTLNTGFTTDLPFGIWFATNVYYGSGFTNGLAGANIGPYNGPYLPAHTTFDVSAGRKLGERWKLTGSVVNVTNHRVLMDNSITLGGFHYNDPRMFMVEARYRFHF
jgi:hypothetical protein